MELIRHCYVGQWPWPVAGGQSIGTLVHDSDSFTRLGHTRSDGVPTLQVLISTQLNLANGELI